MKSLTKLWKYQIFCMSYLLLCEGPQQASRSEENSHEHKKVHYQAVKVPDFIYSCMLIVNWEDKLIKNGDPALPVSILPFES